MRVVLVLSKSLQVCRFDERVVSILDDAEQEVRDNSSSCI